MLRGLVGATGTFLQKIKCFAIVQAGSSPSAFATSTAPEALGNLILSPYTIGTVAEPSRAFSKSCYSQILEESVVAQQICRDFLLTGAPFPAQSLANLDPWLTLRNYY